MPSCLGLYIESNIIKYAKLSKDNGIVKVDSFGIKFYDNLEESLKQIIEETYSYKIPISVNLSNEKYDYFNVFRLLNKKDIVNVISTEFEAICYDKGQNKDAFDTRYMIVDDIENKERVKVIHISANKTDVTKKNVLLEGNKLTTIVPMPISVSNLVNSNRNDNLVIINIEDKTTVTTILGQNINKVETIELGTKQILEKIAEKEQSYSKAYEICKNTTIYTSEGKDLQVEENEYLEYIMPTLYQIVQKTTQILNNQLYTINKIYITGTASVINNIDIYFQEYLGNIKCEILKPYFIKDNGIQINIKDYIEVNSAIALALQGIGEGIKAVNFKKPSFYDSLPDWMRVEVGGKHHKNTNTGKFNFDLDLKGSLTKIEKNLLRSTISILLIIFVYSIFSVIIHKQIENKDKEIKLTANKIQIEIDKVNYDIAKIKTKTNEYTTLIQNLEAMNATIAENLKVKNSIPTLLSQIMNIVPKDVQITSIENTTGKSIQIKAQADNYEQLGYFKAKLKTDNILINVTSDSGQKQDGAVKVIIKGELP